MDYSIIIPVFNKAALTRNCLHTLRASLEGAGDGEVIVIDNASSDETPQMLAEFPWVRVVRNERNLGFAGANNQGAAMARGRFLVLLNNDTEPRPGWLASMLRIAAQTDVGAVGARLLYPDGTLQHAGVVIAQQRFGLPGFIPYHDLARAPADFEQARRVYDFQVVTGACMVTPRELYAQLGGLDEGFWNGYEDVDYCLKLRAMGKRVVYDPDAVLVHFESQSGVQRFRKVPWNVARLAHRWNGRVAFDAQEREIQRGSLRRHVRLPRGHYTMETTAIPPVTLICHGDASKRHDKEFLRALTLNSTPLERVEFVAAGEAVAFARAEMERRGDRYLVFVDTRCALSEGWLDELVRQVEEIPNAGAASFWQSGDREEDRGCLTADARCTLLHLAKFPQHERLGDFPALDEAIGDLLIRALAYRLATRRAAKPLAALPGLGETPGFRRAHGIELSDAVDAGAAEIEQRLRTTAKPKRGLVSIVMLSWNAPQFTKIALESIRAHTRGEYEVVIVDNGSGPETVEWLKTLTGVRVIYNAVNRGYAGGNNQALAEARGEFVVLLNNDVVVTEGWLDGLLHAFDRIPGLGVSAPRSNKIAGDQIVLDATYQDLDAMHRYAAVRRERYRDQGYMTDRAIGLCLCIDRRVIEEIGGIDERYGVGNFEDDDFCLRVRAAGYGIFVCDDVFIHHFGSQTFAANKIDWTATMRENWQKFSSKWDLPRAADGGYVPGPAIRRGFDRAKHYVALPATETPEAPTRTYRKTYAAVVRNERDWNEAGAFARRYMRAFRAHDPVLLAIAALEELPATVLAARLERLAEREGIAPDDVADIDVSDETCLSDFLDGLQTAADLSRVMSGQDATFDALPLTADRSPSSLRRALEEPAAL